MDVLVTGGAGFIGHHLVRALLARGDAVRVVDDLSTGHRGRLAGIAGQFDFTEGSILDADVLDRAFAGCEVIFHQAALASVARSVVAPRTTNEVNVNGTIEVMLAAARHRVRRVVFAGSSSVYGIPDRLPCREDFRPEPQSPYAASKLAAEHYVHVLGRLHGIETVVLRYFNVFGPGQDPTSQYAAVVPLFATATLNGKPATINGDGLTSRDFTYVENVVQANLLAASAAAASGLTCNVASGSRYTLLDLLSRISEAVGRSVPPVFGPPRVGDIRHSQADISLAREALGYEVAVPFAEGIVRTVRSYESAPALG